MTSIEPPAWLGVIGGGQLGRMFVQCAQRMGFRTVVLGPTDDSPAAQVSDDVIVAPPDSMEGLQKLADRVQAATVEFENVSAAGLRWLEKKIPVRPGWRTVWISQDRLREKRFLEDFGFPLAPWCAVEAEADLSRAVADLGLPLILKTASTGYDGKGQIRVETREDISLAWSRLGRVSCVAEQVVDFLCEVSVVVVRGQDGESVAYPTFLNRHKNHILDSTIAPAPIGPHSSMETRALALAVARSLETVGVLTVEFFVTKSGQILINEIAPRPHNSGHLTIEAAQASQFEQQVRALCGLPLGPADLISPGAMVNLLGDLWAHGAPKWRDALRIDPSAHIHLYGKRSAMAGRKMGHVTILDRDPESALSRAIAVRNALSPDRS